MEAIEHTFTGVCVYKRDHVYVSAIVDELADEPRLKNYHLLPSVRGDFLQKLGRMEEARGEFEQAAALTRNERERALLMARALGCASGS